jgi:threonine dehydratase
MNLRTCSATAAQVVEAAQLCRRRGGHELMVVNVEEIKQARRRLEGIVKPTPLIRSTTLEQMLGAEVYLKPENLQKTGSFKIRGAYNRIAVLSPPEAARGVVAASAGNHGQALAYAATRAGIKATIVMPVTAAIAKVDATRSYGQEVVLAGADYQAARCAAEELRDLTGAVFIDAYDDPHVIAGQGTIGLEIPDEVAPDVVIVPVGGGGLIAGIAVALAARVPEAEIIGAEAAGSPQLSLSLAAGSPAPVTQPVDTIADGLATGRIGRLPFELIRGHVRRAVTVDDFEIGEAVLLLLERMKLLVEGAGAAGLAAALKIRAELAGKRVAICISGGNIDINLLDRIIGYGLAKAGRLMRFAIELHDRPGELQKLLLLIGQTGANVRSIEHDHTRRDVPIGSVRVMLELETRSADHLDELRRRLAERGYSIAGDNSI